MTALGRWGNQSIYDINNDSTMEDQSRQEFTDAINHCLDLLRENNYITDINMDVISRRSAIIGQEIYEYLKQIITRESNTKAAAKLDKNRTPSVIPIVNCENITLNNFIKQEPIEIIDTQQPENFIEQRSTSDMRARRRTRSRSTKKMDVSGDSYNSMFETNPDDYDATTATSTTTRTSTPTLKASCAKREYTMIPLDVKSRVLNIAHSNPTWGLKELRKYGCKKLTSMSTLRKWRMHVKNGGTKLDKLNMINCMTYNRYKEACDNNEIVTTAMIREWAIRAAEKYQDGGLKFEASQQWIHKFKLQHGIPLDDVIDPDNKFAI